MPRYACACHGRDVECGNGLTTTCANRKQIVVVPTVLKGLNNQRMRIVSDIVGAILIGAAVQLPAKLAARRSCHFRVECYKNYEPVLPIWDVFDEATTLKALKQAGACMAPARRETTTSPVYIKRARADLQYLRTPIAASQLERLAANESLVNGKGQPLRRISFGGSGDCCVLFVPDSMKARRLFREVNAAFATAPALSSISRSVLSRFRETTGGGRTLALHWRAETDMSQSSHALNIADYVRGVIDLLAKHQQPPRTHCILLGDHDEAETRAVAAQLGAASSWLTLHSKATLIGAFRASVPRALANLDDAVGMIDFEIGAQADLFIGAPFSSFSVMIALARAAASDGRRRQQLTTLMATGADTVDRLGEIFAAAFPFRSVVHADPCATLIKVHPAYATRAGLTNCRTRGLDEIRLLSIPHCDACGVPWCLNNTDPMLARMGNRYRKWQSCATRGGPVNANRSTLDGWGGCGSLEVATAKRDLLRTPARELIFRAVTETELMPRQLPSLRGRLDRDREEHSAQRAGGDACSDLAPRFVFEPPLDHQLNCQLAVVTSSFGTRDTITRIDEAGADELATFEQDFGLRSCWFAFVDEAAFGSLNAVHHMVPTAASKVRRPAAYRLVRWGLWNLVVLHRAMLPFEDMSRNSRVPKMLLHRLFGSATFALYMDSKLKFERSPLKVWSFVSEQFFGQSSSNPAWISPKHNERRSMYEEARCVMKLGLVSKAVVQRQLDAYAAEKFPEAPFEAGGPGLIEGEWHLRDLRSAEQSKIGCGWLQEFVKRGHKRDQLSFNYVVWKLGLLPTQRGNRTLFVDYGMGGGVFDHVESAARKREGRWRQKSNLACL